MMSVFRKSSFIALLLLLSLLVVDPVFALPRPPKNLGHPPSITDPLWKINPSHSVLVDLANNHSSNRIVNNAYDSNPSYGIINNAYDSKPSYGSTQQTENQITLSDVADVAENLRDAQPVFERQMDEYNQNPSKSNLLTLLPTLFYVACGFCAIGLFIYQLNTSQARR